MLNTIGFTVDPQWLQCELRPPTVCCGTNTSRFTLVVKLIVFTRDMALESTRLASLCRCLRISTMSEATTGWCNQRFFTLAISQGDLFQVRGQRLARCCLARSFGLAHSLARSNTRRCWRWAYRWFFHTIPLQLDSNAQCAWSLGDGVDGGAASARSRRYAAPSGSRLAEGARIWEINCRVSVDCGNSSSGMRSWAAALRPSPRKIA